MVTNNIYRFICAALIGGAVGFGLPACTDDHFDVNDGGEVGANATLTLWEQISARPELSNFARVLEKTPCFKDETHIMKHDDGSAYTFKDVLSGTQTLTVFAPTNDAFDQSARDKVLALIETQPYDAFLQMAGNHIVRYSRPTTGDGVIDMVTINGKRAVMDRDKNTFKNVRLLTSDIMATNGTLHTIGTVLPFNYNLYELIKVDPRFTEMKAWLTEHDTIYFDEDRSAAGGTDMDGNPIYVDSIYTSINTLFFMDYEEPNGNWIMPHKGYRANFRAEDSIWAVVLPTDAAWQEAYERIADYYVYSPYYTDKSDEDGLTTNSALAKYFSLGGKEGADSLSKLSRRMDLASSGIFNLRLQPRKFSGFWTKEKFLAAAEMPQMFNTRRDTFEVNDGLSGDVRVSLFQGTQPEDISNGIVYPVNYWSLMDDDASFVVEAEADYRHVFQASNMGTTTYSTMRFDNASPLAVDSMLGPVSESNFMYVTAGNSTPSITFKLIDYKYDRQIVSNMEYEVFVVMVPDFYRIDKDSITGTAYKNSLQANIFYNSGKSPVSNKIAETKSPAMKFEYEGKKVEEISIGTIMFEYSYKNMQKSYPTITITSVAKPSDLRKGYQNSFNIDRIILRPKKDERVTL